MSNGVIGGNILAMTVGYVTFTLQHRGGGSSEQTFTFTGVKTGDMVFVSKPGYYGHGRLLRFRVSAADTIAVTFIATAAADGPSETYQVSLCARTTRPAPLLIT